MMKKLIFVISFLLVPSMAFCAATWHTSEIKLVYPLATGTVVLVFDTPAASCTNGGKYHYIQKGKNGVTQEGLDKIFGSALAAAMASKRVSINFDNSANQCYINRLNIQF